MLKSMVNSWGPRSDGVFDYLALTLNHARVKPTKVASSEDPLLAEFQPCLQRQPWVSCLLLQACSNAAQNWPMQPATIPPPPCTVPILMHPANIFLASRFFPCAVPVLTHPANVFQASCSESAVPPALSEPTHINTLLLHPVALLLHPAVIFHASSLSRASHLVWK